MASASSASSASTACSLQLAIFQEEFPGGKELLVTEHTHDMISLMKAINDLNDPGIKYYTRYQSYPIKWSFFVAPSQEILFKNLVRHYRKY